MMREEWQCWGGVVGWTLAIAALLIAVPPVASAIVVPNAQTAVEGNTNNDFPFGCSSFSSMRYQQVYLGSEVGSGTITQIAFRQDGVSGGAFGPTTINGITITLSSTSAAPDGLSTTFANNVGADVTTVFTGNLTLSSAACPGAGPCPFDIVIPLQTPFSFNPAGGLNLLLDVTIPTCVSITIFDAQQSTDSVSRAFTTTLGSGSPTADPTDTAGLVTQFTNTQGIPTLSEWAMIAMVLLLVGIAVWRLRRRPAFSA
jgi:hypothetical protein